jgi:Mg/Co/Ni transporter MgtE
VAQAIERARTSDLGAQQVSTVCVLEDDGRLVGAVSLADLLRADGAQRVVGLLDESLPCVAAEADLPEVAVVMTDYNLIAIPVVDSDGRVAGLIAVDDILEQLIPEEWRWRAGAARG